MARPTAAPSARTRVKRVHDRAVHVLNAPSPAATASLAIGEEIAALALALAQ